MHTMKKEVDAIKEAGLFKGEKLITSPQGAKVKLEDGRELLNMCANNYLGLANDSRVMASAAKSYEERGYGLSSVRFICGTQDVHKELEAASQPLFRNGGYNFVFILF